MNYNNNNHSSSDQEEENNVVQSSIQHYATNTIPTTLAITSTDSHATAAQQDEEEDIIPMDPILSLTNWIASLIDSLSGMGCGYLWLQTTNDPSDNATTTSLTISADDWIRFCEELVYLDVAGPTLTSRLEIESMVWDYLRYLKYMSYVISPDSLN